MNDPREGASGFRREGWRGPVPVRRELREGVELVVGGGAAGVVEVVEVVSTDLEMEDLKAWVSVPFARW